MAKKEFRRECMFILKTTRTHLAKQKLTEKIIFVKNREVR